MKFLDFAYSAEGRQLKHWGVEGESFEGAGDSREYTASFEDALEQSPGEPVWEFFQDRVSIPVSADNDAYYKWGDDQTRALSSEYFSNYVVSSPILRYSPEQLDERSAIIADLQPFIDAQTVAFITGDRSLTEWDNFLQEAEERGAREVTAIDQAAYEAMQG